MNNLLKEAIADAKAVRETAMANAKIALEEAFTPRLQSMLSARLAEEADEEVTDEEEEMEMPAEGYENDEDGTPDPGPAIEEEEMEEEGLDLESIIRELEEELESSNIGGDDSTADLYEEDEADMEMSVEPAEEEEEEEINIEEIVRALREEDDKEDMKEEDDKEDMQEEEETKKELEEAYRVIKFMRSKLNEVNLLNAKLLFSNKLFRNYPLNENQKMKVIENFDRANSIREVKLVYSTLCESLKTVNKQKTNIKESYASKPVGKSTAPKKEILSEGSELAVRWKKLANLK